MDEFTFTLNGTEMTAVNAGWSKGDEEVWDILDSEENFVASVMVHPFDHISVVVEKWAETEQAFLTA
jgi:hypothetical protein